MIELASTIVRKYERALREQAEISEYFTDITQSSPQHLIPVWTCDIEHAEATRQENVKSMDYMNPKIEKRVYPLILHFVT
jgi:regulatory protein YycI of two-component signal transduction system YycFG